jgi:hypothetical protein
VYTPGTAGRERPWYGRRLLGVTLPDGTKLALALPAEWDAGVEDASIEGWHRIGDSIAAKVRPLSRTFNRLTRSRAHRSGWGFWSATTGDFERWGDPEWSALVPLASGELLACRYPEHTIQRVGWPDLAVKGACKLDLAQCGIEEIVVSPSQRLALAVLESGHGEAGYELLEVATMKRLAGGPGFKLPVMTSPPAFTPDEKHVLAVFGASASDPYNRAWWLGPSAPEDADDDATSPGGFLPFATLLVHDLATETSKRFPVDVDLPKGWTADRYDTEWCVPALAEVGDEHVVLAMPDGHRIRVALPVTGARVVLAGVGPGTG